MQEHVPQTPNQEQITEFQEQIRNHANWQQRVDTTPKETGAKPSKNGIDAQDIAYDMWLEENASDEHAGNTLRGLVKADAEDQAKAERRERLRELARMSMHVKTGIATGEEAAYYYTLQEKHEPTKQSEDTARSEVQAAHSEVVPEVTTKTEDKPKPSTAPSKESAQTQNAKTESSPTKSAKAEPKPAKIIPPKKLQVDPKPVESKSKLLKKPLEWVKRGYQSVLTAWNNYRTKKTVPQEQAQPEVKTAEALKFTFDSESQTARYRFGTGEKKSGTPNEDAMITDPANELFAVFDGAGGAGGNPNAASNAAANAIQEFFASEVVKTILAKTDLSEQEALDTMKMAFRHARQNVADHGEEGTTTAAVLKFVRIGGQQFALVGNAGDSRILLGETPYKQFAADLLPTDKPDVKFEVVSDQSDGHILLNALSGDNSSNKADEYALIPVAPGERFIICTDGITGDVPSQFLAMHELQNVFNAKTAKDATDLLLAYSKKNDDKSVIVIDITA